MTLRVSTSNFYVGNTQPTHDAHTLAGLKCDLSGVQEGHSGNARAIKDTLKTTHTVWWKTVRDKDLQMGFMDVPVVINPRLHVLKIWARLISKRAQKRDIGMPRAATAVRFKWNTHTITFINTHTNAAVQNPDTGKPYSSSIARVYQYIKGMIVLEAMIVNAKLRGDMVILVGDLNFKKVKTGVWKFSPQAMFRRQNMNSVSNGLDYIAFTKGFKRYGNVHFVRTSRTGSDHDWVYLDLQVGG